MKYIILTGGDGGFGNLGDEWLLGAVKNRYKKVVNKYNIVILQANVPILKFERFSYCKDSEECFKKLNVLPKDIELVHFYGGGYINSFWISDKLWFYNYLINAGLSPKKIVFTCQGLGPFEKKEENRISNIAKDCAFFGTRDMNYKDSVNSNFMFDETILYADKACQVSKSKDLLVNIRLARHVGVDEKKIADLLKLLVNISNDYGLRLKFFAMIKGKNFDEKLELQRLLEENNIQYDVLNRPKNYKGLYRLYKNAAMVVTTSYHATLAALYSGIPTVSVYENNYYNLKYTGLHTALNTPLLTLLDLNHFKTDVFDLALKNNDVNLLKKLERLNSISLNYYNKLIGPLI